MDSEMCRLVGAGLELPKPLRQLIQFLPEVLHGLQAPRFDSTLLSIGQRCD